MKPGVSASLRIFCSLIFILLYCEWFVYYLVLIQCDWPSVGPGLADSILKSNEQEVRALILADTHLLGSRRGHWFDKLRREWQMQRAFQTAINLHRPDVVFVLGDVTDEGEFCGEKEFDEFVDRFEKLFAVPKETRMHVVVGNHDIGFHYRITPYLNRRFVKGFNSTAVQAISLRGNHFVLVNSMALEGDGCFLCKAAELELARIEKMLKCLKTNSTCNNKEFKLYSPPVLMTHFPLYRESEADCNEPDEAPFPLKHQKYREGWDCLSRGSTYQILKQIEPRLVLSGHSHHGCTRNLSVGNGLEITLPSFSWRNKNNPSYGLFVFTPHHYAFFKCLMPQESSVIYCYVVGVCISFLWTIYVLYVQKRKRKFKYL